MKIILLIIIVFFFNSSCVMDSFDKRLNIINKSKSEVFIYKDNRDDLSIIIKEDSTSLLKNKYSMRHLFLKKDSIENILLISGSSYKWEDYFEENQFLYIYAFDTTQYDSSFYNTCKNNKYYKKLKINLDTIKKYNWTIPVW